MSKEIKFRGKQNCNGKWMYGDLLHLEQNSIYDIASLNSKAEVIGNIHDNPELLTNE